ncbi:MAG: Panacea domain-containing protein [Candidatus Gallimonas sp.]
MYKAEQIANWFVARAIQDVNENGGEYMSHLKLQKLLYFAQGCYSAMEDKPLFEEKIYSWAHGPVVASLYQKYKKYKDRGIDKFDPVSIDDHTKSILEEVYRVFGQYSAWALREITHQQDPWKQTPIDEEIPLWLITKYFKEKIISD